MDTSKFYQNSKILLHISSKSVYPSCKIENTLECMKTLYLFASTIFGLFFTTSVTHALSQIEIEKIAKSTTVKIEYTTKEGILIEGSGFIIDRQGNNYTVATNDHVLNCSACIYTIRTVDDQSYYVQPKATNSLASKSNLDIAFIKFNSNKNYITASIGSSSKLKIRDKVYTTGFPLKSRTFSFNSGIIKANSFKRLEGDRGGYTMIYNAFTAKGMSGSGVFNDQGQVVAIHGSGDKYVKNTYKLNDEFVGRKVGLNRGVPIDFLSGIKPNSSFQLPSTADDFFILGFNRYVEPDETNVFGSRREALNFLSKAIALRPNYEAAYFSRGYVLSQLDYFKEALNDYNKYIEIDPYYANTYNNRALIKSDNFNEDSSALADYDKAISLNPKEFVFYLNRGSLKRRKLLDYPGALNDLNAAVRLAPDFPACYFIRGNIKFFGLQDLSGAISDYDQAISINKDFAEAHHNRGLLRIDLKENNRAKKDLNRAAQLYKAKGDLDGYNKVVSLLQGL
jgi:tetratricopeptide (TPR) repeat protein